MKHRTNVSITREGWYYMGMMGFVIAGAMIRDINLLYIMAGMMLGPLLFSFYAATRSLRRLQLKRRFQHVISVGEPLHIEVIGSKAKGNPRGLAVMVRDTIQRVGESRRTSRSAELFFPHIQPGQLTENSYCVRLDRRGKYRLGPLQGSTGMPVGLVRASATCGVDESVLVSPRLGALLPGWARQLELKSEGGQKSVRRLGKAEGDFYGMREWRDGDSRNGIHWRTSAKRGKLTVRQFEQRTNQDLVVILDLYQPPDGPISSETVELAISFAATLVVEQCKLSSTQMSVAIASEQGFVLQGLSSPVFRNEVMERMATIDASVHDTLPEVLADVLTRATSNAKIVLISTTPRDLRDTEVFEVLWKRTDVRRSIGDIVKVEAGTGLNELFQLDSPGEEPTKVPPGQPNATPTQEVVL